MSADDKTAGFTLRAMLADPDVPNALRPTTAQDLMRKGIDIMEARAKEYDATLPKGERSIARVVCAFNAITGHELKESEGWLFMQLLKDVRLFSAKGWHFDSGVDAINYTALMAEARKREAT